MPAVMPETRIHFVDEGAPAAAVTLLRPAVRSLRSPMVSPGWEQQVRWSRDERRKVTPVRAALRAASSMGWYARDVAGAWPPGWRRARGR